MQSTLTGVKDYRHTGHSGATYIVGLMTRNTNSLLLPMILTNYDGCYFSLFLKMTHEHKKWH